MRNAKAMLTFNEGGDGYTLCLHCFIILEIIYVLLKNSFVTVDYDCIVLGLHLESVFSMTSISWQRIN